MTLGPFFRENRWQKIFSIGMALMIWLTVRSTEGLRIANAMSGPSRVFDTVPVAVLTSASNLGRYRVLPRTVRVELRGDPMVLGRLPESDLEAYVNLMDLQATPQMIALHINPPPGTQLVSVAPAKVLVDRLPDDNPPDSP